MLSSDYTFSIFCLQIIISLLLTNDLKNIININTYVVGYINKENIDAKTPENKESRSKKDKNTLAVPLPLSPCNVFKKNHCFDKTENISTPKTSNWCLETPKEMKTYSTRARKAQTEKKTAKKDSVANLFSTPFPSKTIPKVKIFCDEDNADAPKTVKRRGRPPKGNSTIKKTDKKEKPVDIKLVQRRKLFDSDTEEEVKPRRPERRLFDDSDETEIPEDEKNSFPCSDDSAIIETSFIDNSSKSRLCLPLTPPSTGLEGSLKQLSIADKKGKLLSLSTTKVKQLQDTPHSSQKKATLRK